MFSWFIRHRDERRRASRERAQKRAALYRTRLAEIDESESDERPRGPHQWNIGLGQSEFLGLVGEGKYAGQYFLVDVYGLPTADGRREESDQWLSASHEELLDSVDGYMVMVLRAREDQRVLAPYGGPWFEDLDSLQKFLAPMDVEWKGAVEALDLFDRNDWSPDWNDD